MNTRENPAAVPDRLGRGGNNPPTLVDERPDTMPPMVAKADELLKNADRWFAERAEVKDDAEAGILAGAIRQVQTLRKAADEARKVEKKPYWDGGKAVDDKWNVILDKLEAAGRTLNKIAVAWARVLEKRQREAAEEARKRAEQLAKEAQDLVDKAAGGNATSQVVAQQAVKAAETAHQEAGAAAAAKPQLKGNLSDRAVGLRRRVVFDEVTDLDAALHHYATDTKMFDLIRELANRDLRADQAAVIPGIKTKVEEGVA